MQYRRANTKGGCYFFTVNLAQRHHTLLTDEIDKLRNVMGQVKKRHPFKLDAIVVLPEHLHALWTLPKDEPCNASRRTRGERGIWQRRYWEHLVRDEEDFRRHVDYIHYNAVKHGYVNRASDWPYSSIHRDISNGILPESWGCGMDPFDGQSFGERN